MTGKICCVFLDHILCHVKEQVLGWSRVIPCQAITWLCGQRLKIGLFTYILLISIEIVLIYFIKPQKMWYNITKSAKSESVSARTLGPCDKITWKDTVMLRYDHHQYDVFPTFMEVVHRSPKW